MAPDEQSAEAGLLLVLNAGSSSLKFALYELPLRPSETRPKPRTGGQIAGIGRSGIFQAAGQPLPTPGGIADHAEAIGLLLDWLEDEAYAGRLSGVGHRVVHGGSGFVAPVRLDAAAIDALSALSVLAPHHQPHNIAAIRALAARRPDLSQVACFDTSFHATQPEEACRLPLPREFHDRGIRRYGFHGLSYESIIAQLPAVAGMIPRRLVVAHLGNGASMCAILDGRSVATTMGFSTLDGIPMATRSGSLDPGVLLHLLREGMSAPEIEDLLYNRAGLLALSGLSPDMRTLLESREPEAAAALRFYCYRINRELASLAATLGGLDALVFTGGIGENAPSIRAAVSRDASWLGLELDEEANAAGGPRLTHPESRAAAWVIPTDEQGVIARYTAALLDLQLGDHCPTNGKQN